MFLRGSSAVVLGLSGFLPAWATGAGGCTADSDGMLRVEGRRRFVLGLYQLPKRDGSLARAAAAGIDVLSLPPERKAYDEAHAVGVRGWSSVGSLAEGSGRAATERGIREKVEALRSHPGLLFWETEDEPTFVWKEPEKVRVGPDRMNGTARFIRGLDGAHPIYLNHSPTHQVSTLSAYNPGAGIVATDIYPVIPAGIRELYALWPDGRQGDLSDTTLGQVGRYADKMRAVAGPSRPVFMVLQGFAWEDLRDKDRDPAMVLYPTAAELRFMAWQAVVHGVNGILWWGLAFLPPGVQLWDDLLGVVGELSSVREALSAPVRRVPIKVRYHETGHTLDRGIEWLAKADGRGLLLVVVNPDPSPVDVTLWGWRGQWRWTLLFEGGKSEGVGAELRARIEPYGRRVWRMMRGGGP